MPTLYEKGNDSFHCAELSLRLYAKVGLCLLLYLEIVVSIFGLSLLYRAKVIVHTA